MKIFNPYNYYLRAGPTQLLSIILLQSFRHISFFTLFRVVGTAAAVKLSILLPLQAVGMTLAFQLQFITNEVKPRLSEAKVSDNDWPSSQISTLFEQLKSTSAMPSYMCSSCNVCIWGGGLVICHCWHFPPCNINSGFFFGRPKKKLKGKKLKL